MVYTLTKNKQIFTCLIKTLNKNYGFGRKLRQIDDLTLKNLHENGTKLLKSGKNFGMRSPAPRCLGEATRCGLPLFTTTRRAGAAGHGIRRACCPSPPLKPPRTQKTKNFSQFSAAGRRRKEARPVFAGLQVLPLPRPAAAGSLGAHALPRCLGRRRVREQPFPSLLPG